MEKNEEVANEIKRILVAINRANGIVNKKYATKRTDEDMTSSRWNVLSAVNQLKHPTISSVGRALKSSRQNIAIIVSSMVGDGLLEMVDNPEHKRSKILQVTNMGLEKLNRSAGQRDDICYDMSLYFNLEELQSTRSILQKIYNKLDV
ncbi:MAG: MarR family winged helix-turn-helix transcriptional regulator [Alphaproteobacteria bacterium]